MCLFVNVCLRYSPERLTVLFVFVCLFVCVCMCVSVCLVNYSFVFLFVRLLYRIFECFV